jgi:tyrosyl-DNA phosphodiesterase-1
MKIVHGFWKREDERKLSLEVCHPFSSQPAQSNDNMQEAASRYPNIKLIGAYMPDPFGTHHSKMLILIRHDDQAQVIIHTANMISRDWGNMTQAIWRSPLLPLRVPTGDRPQQESYPIGSGQRFKVDLLRYVGAYGRRLSELKSQLQNYDFSAIRAAFIGSTPSREKPRQAKPNLQTLWGWPGIQEILSNVPIPSASSGGDGTGTPNIIIQISSIATLGPTTTWLENFQRALSKCKAASSTTNNGAFTNARKPTFNIIFPTATEIRTSLDGYASGASIHTKLQSHTQQKQLDYLRPYLRHWKHLNPANDAPYASTSPSPSPSPSKTSTTTTTRSADRGPAAPHIKTYIRFHDKQQRRIDWAMVTSANLSKQAWGEVENKNGEVWIQSWECGVVVWPALFPSSLEGSSDGKQQGEEEENGNGEEGVEMVPVFGKDTPSGEDIGEACARTPKVLVGLRMPYDLPLEPYGEDDVPWCASMVHEEPDWMGRVWGV